MSRNLVPRTNKGSDLGTTEKNWNRLYADAVILRGRDLQALLDGKTDLETLTAKGDLYVATDAGVITRLPAGADGYILKVDSGAPGGLMWGPGGARQELTENITVTVGSGGQFNTINSALENIVALYYPKYISGGNCPRVTINLLPDFVMSEQVLVESLDLSWITITGDAAETTINKSALTKEFGIGYPAFAAINGGSLPIIGQLFIMDTSSTGGSRHGIVAFINSRAVVLSGCGVKNAGAYGVYAHTGSMIEASGADFSGAGIYGIAANICSTINALGAYACNCGNTSISASRNSMINAEAAYAYNANYYGIAATLCSTIIADTADASNAGTYGLYAANGSTINAYTADASNAGTYGIFATQTSIINARGANASGALGSYGISVGLGSIINANNATGTLNISANTITGNGIIFQ